MRKLLKITLCAALALILTSSTPTVPDATCDASPRPANEAVYRHNTDKKRVALTFDDGPHYKYTAEILDILDEYGAKATFFVVGELAERYPELILRELAEGHEIGNHTWSHPKMKKLTVDSLKQEILKTEELLNEIADYRPKLFRPPEGSFSDLDHAPWNRHFFQTAAVLKCPTPDRFKIVRKMNFLKAAAAVKSLVPQFQ